MIDWLLDWPSWLFWAVVVFVVFTAWDVMQWLRKRGTRGRES